MENDVDDLIAAQFFCVGALTKKEPPFAAIGLVNTLRNFDFEHRRCELSKRDVDRRITASRDTLHFAHLFVGYSRSTNTSVVVDAKIDASTGRIRECNHFTSKITVCSF